MNPETELNKNITNNKIFLFLVSFLSLLPLLAQIPWFYVFPGPLLIILFFPYLIYSQFIAAQLLPGYYRCDWGCEVNSLPGFVVVTVIWVVLVMFLLYKIFALFRNRLPAPTPSYFNFKYTLIILTILYAAFVLITGYQTKGLSLFASGSLSNNVVSLEPKKFYSLDEKLTEYSALAEESSTYDISENGSEVIIRGPQVTINFFKEGNYYNILQRDDAILIKYLEPGQTSEFKYIYYRKDIGIRKFEVSLPKPYTQGFQAGNRYIARPTNIVFTGDVIYISTFSANDDKYSTAVFSYDIHTQELNKIYTADDRYCVIDGIGYKDSFLYILETPNGTARWQPACVAHKIAT